MNTTKKYWKGLEELNQEQEFLDKAHSEFPEFVSVKENTEFEGTGETTRRDFLKLMGFTVAAVSLAACETPTKKVIPYITKPEGVDPGVANWYASTYAKGSRYSSILVKTREGRPIKIEGNDMSSITKGGVSTLVSASILGLYDSSRLTNFTKGNATIKKADADKEIIAALKSLPAGSKVRIVSETILSPSTKAVIKDFATAYASLDVKHVVYDPVSAAGILKANGGVIPGYDFSAAETIVSFSADFLGSWISPVEYTKQYAQTRKVSESKKTMSKHFQFESNFTLTGANADVRTAIKPSEEPYYIIELYNAIASASGASTISNPFKISKAKAVKDAASALLSSKGKSLVVSGMNDEGVQLIVAKINELLSANGSTIKDASLLKQGNDDDMLAFVKELTAGQVAAVIFYGANPVYDHPSGSQIEKALKSVKLSVSFADRADETSSICTYICPDLHFLESWGDAEPKKGYFSLSQPTISPIFDMPAKGWENRSAQESLLTWSGVSGASYYNYLKAFWSANLSGASWDKVLHDGVYEPKTSISAPVVATSSVASVDAAVSRIASFYKPGAGLEVTVYESISLGSGDLANNPWVHENPDPISKVTWDNYLAVNKNDFKDAKLGDLATVTVNGVSVTLPIVAQPGQAKGSVGVALGYGRTKAGKMQENLMHKNPEGKNVIGINVYPFLKANGSTLSYIGAAQVKTTGESYNVAQTQTHHTIMTRDTKGEETIIAEATLSDFKNGKSGVIHKTISTSEGNLAPNQVDLWAVPVVDEKGNHKEVKTHTYDNHFWGMVIDLNSCTGCGACHVSCQVENNIPVVGKDEVLRRREMHWMRIDRYYSTDADVNDKTISGFDKMEEPGENPSVVFQPMMCQHCNHAPCETVCPVAATTHSSEGLNQMTYNRCIGTRYCANNCPYKVRRFNWFNYSDTKASDREFSNVNVTMNDDLGKMVLNPDVVVRARGTMEKCSMCVQRIQAGKLQAKVEGRRTKDGDIKTACQSVCPADAITFGDMNDPNSNISKIIKKDNASRAYNVLDEINVKPSITYLSKIRNI